MAKKRMISNQVIDRDFFVELPLTAQALYFHLVAKADDDGFLDGVRRIQRNIGASDADMRALVNAGLVINFDDGVLVIRHWRIHNAIRADRYTPTLYQREKKTLELNDNKEYEVVGIPSGTEMSYQMATKMSYQMVATDKNRLDKNSIDKISIDKGSIGEGSETELPSADEEEEHLNTRHNFQEVTKAWNELKPFGVNSVTKVVPTTERGKCLKARIADYGLDDVLKAIDLVKQSKFLQGNNDRDWKITFDWFVKPNNFIKVLEGNYTDTEPKKATDPLDRSNFDSYEAWHKAELEATFGSFDD